MWKCTKKFLCTFHTYAYQFAEISSCRDGNCLMRKLFFLLSRSKRDKLQIGNLKFSLSIHRIVGASLDETLNSAIAQTTGLQDEFFFCPVVFSCWNYTIFFWKSSKVALWTKEKIKWHCNCTIVTELITRLWSKYKVRTNTMHCIWTIVDCTVKKYSRFH